jgi:hypothetical protein
VRKKEKPEGRKSRHGDGGERKTCGSKKNREERRESYRADYVD